MDPFHVVAWMTDVLERVVREDKRLYRAYLLKEILRDVFESTDGARAAERLDSWLRSACRSASTDVKEMSKKARRHKEAIVRAVELGIFNAHVEAINNKIKLTVRMGYGFRNIENLIALVMLSLLEPADSASWEGLITHRNWRSLIQINEISMSPFLPRLHSANRMSSAYLSSIESIPEAHCFSNACASLCLISHPDRFSPSRSSVISSCPSPASRKNTHPSRFASSWTIRNKFTKRASLRSFSVFIPRTSAAFTLSHPWLRWHELAPACGIKEKGQRR